VSQDFVGYFKSFWNYFDFIPPFLIGSIVVFDQIRIKDKTNITGMHISI